MAQILVRDLDDADGRGAQGSARKRTAAPCKGEVKA